MIRIRRDQLPPLSRASGEGTCDWIVAVLRAVFPDAASASVAELDAGVARQVERAAGYCLERDDHVAIYAMTAWVLGDDFPERFTAAGAVLSARDTTPERKVEWLEAWTQTLLQALEQQA